MSGFSDMSNHRIAAIAAVLAISVALVSFVVAVVSGMNAGLDDNGTLKSDEPPVVRYAMSYAIDSDLYSFYKQQEERNHVVRYDADPSK